MKKLLQIKKTSLQAAYCLFFLMCCFAPNLQAQWTQVGATISGTTNNEQLGTSVASSSDGSIVAVSNANSQVKVYQNVSGTWTQLGATFTANNFALSGDGTTLALGVGSYSSRSVQIYQYSSGAWNSTTNLSSYETYDTGFGKALVLSYDGTKIAVGEPTHGFE